MSTSDDRGERVEGPLDNLMSAIIDFDFEPIQRLIAIGRRLIESKIGHKSILAVPGKIFVLCGITCKCNLTKPYLS